MIDKRSLKEFYDNRKVLMYTDSQVLCVDVDGAYDANVFNGLALHGVHMATTAYYYSVDICTKLDVLGDRHVLFQEYSDMLNQTEVLQKGVQAVERTAKLTPFTQLIVLNFGVSKLSYALSKGLSRLITKVRQQPGTYLLVLAKDSRVYTQSDEAHISAKGDLTWYIGTETAHPVGVSEDNILLYIANETILRSLLSVTNAALDGLNVGPDYYRDLSDKTATMRQSFVDGMSTLWEEDNVQSD